jgi:hypothetical protein
VRCRYHSWNRSGRTGACRGISNCSPFFEARRQRCLCERHCVAASAAPRNDRFYSKKPEHRDYPPPISLLLQWLCRINLTGLSGCEVFTVETTQLNDAKAKRPIGKCRWALAEGYLPEWSHSQDRRLISHEALCILNASDQNADVQIMVYFSDRDPVGPYSVHVPARRTKHLRFDDFLEPAPIPPGVDFSSVIESNTPIVVQHTRLDSRDPNIALMTTIAYSEA